MGDCGGVIAGFMFDDGDCFDDGVFLLSVEKMSDFFRAAHETMEGLSDVERMR